MKNPDFYLLSDSSIICSYLVSQWIDTFSDRPGFQGILLKEELQSESTIQARKEFHTQYCGQKKLTPEGNKALIELYPDLDRTEQAMIKTYGVAPYPASGHPKTIFLGNNVNSKKTKEWLREIAQKSPPFVFVCMTQILKEWWIELTQSQIINAHTAVLPYARGMYAIENMAILGDINQFRKAAGITIHYVDKGVDTGNIILAQRIIDPFQFESIWDLKAYTYLLEFDLYIKVAQAIFADTQTLPAGICQNPALQGPNFRIKNFTREKQLQAEKNYLLMKEKQNL
ncbi:hypothetical protein AY600_01915 [Phormidium willei BDU 130791]|nr:hypothetical protein AY600_01915 [Phormidium willei BDU 130791]